uniref:Uncharacterized protein n=1 Tax=Strongyloides stercoralis TaxID=6248 RepID=A0AAF5DML5_STRER
MEEKEESIHEDTYIKDENKIPEHLVETDNQIDETKEIETENDYEADVERRESPLIERDIIHESHISEKEEKPISELLKDDNKSKLIENLEEPTIYYHDLDKLIEKTDKHDYEEDLQPEIKESEYVVVEEIPEITKQVDKRDAKSPEINDIYEDVETIVTTTTHQDDLDKSIEEPVQYNYEKDLQPEIEEQKLEVVETIPETIKQERESVTQSPESKDDNESIETTTTTYYDYSDKHKKIEYELKKESSETAIIEELPETIKEGEEIITKSPEVKDDYETVEITTTTTYYDDSDKPIEEIYQPDYKEDYQVNLQDQEPEIVKELPETVEHEGQTVVKSPELTDDYEKVETIVTTTTTYYDESGKPIKEKGTKDGETVVDENVPKTVEHKEETVVKSPKITDDYEKVETIVTTTTYYDESDRPIEEYLQPEIKDNEFVIDEKVPETSTEKEEIGLKSPEITDDYETVETIVTTTTYYDDSDKPIEEKYQPDLQDQEHTVIDELPQKVEHKEETVVKSPEITDDYETKETVVTTKTNYDDLDKPIEDKYQPDYEKEYKEDDYENVETVVDEKVPETVKGSEEIITRSPKIKDDYETVETIVTTTTYYDDSDKPIEEKYQPDLQDQEHTVIDELPQKVEHKEETVVKSPEITDDYETVETVVTTKTYYDDLDKPIEDNYQPDYEKEYKKDIQGQEPTVIEEVPETAEQKEETVVKSPEITDDYENVETVVDEIVPETVKDDYETVETIVTTTTYYDDLDKPIEDNYQPDIQGQEPTVIEEVPETAEQKEETVVKSPEITDDYETVETIVTTTTYYEDSDKPIEDNYQPDYEKENKEDIQDQELTIIEEVPQTAEQKDETDVKSPEITDDYENVETIVTTTTTYYDESGKPTKEEDQKDEETVVDEIVPETVKGSEEIITKSPEITDDYETVETVVTTKTYYDDLDKPIEDNYQPDFEKEYKEDIQDQEPTVIEEVPETAEQKEETVAKSPEITDDHENVETIVTTTTTYYDESGKPIKEEDQKGEETVVDEIVPETVKGSEEIITKSPEIKDDYETVETIVTTTTYYEDSDKPIEERYQPDLEDQESAIVKESPETIEHEEKTVVKSPELTDDYEKVETIVTTTATYYDDSGKLIEEPVKYDYQLDLQLEIKDDESVVDEKVPEIVAKSPEIKDDYETVKTIVTTTTTYYDDSEKPIEEIYQRDYEKEYQPEFQDQELTGIEELPEIAEQKDETDVKSPKITDSKPVVDEKVSEPFTGKEEIVTKSPESEDDHDTVETFVTTKTAYYDESDKPIKEAYEIDLDKDLQPEIETQEPQVFEQLPKIIQKEEETVSKSPEVKDDYEKVESIVTTTTTYYDDSDKPIEKEDQHDFESHIQPDIRDHESVVEQISERYDEKEEILSESPEIKTDFESYEVNVEPIITDENKYGDSDKAEIIESPIIEDIADSQLPSVERKYSVESPVEKREIISESPKDLDDRNIVESVVTTTTYYDDSVNHVGETEHPDYEKYYQPDVKDSESVVDEELPETIQHTDEIVETTIPRTSYSDDNLNDDKEIDSQIEISNIVTKEQEDDDLHKPCEDLTPEVSHYDIDKKIEEYYEPEVEKEDILSSDKFVDSIVTKDDTAEPFIKEEVVKDDLHDVKSTIRSQLIFDEIQHRPESPTSEDEYLPESHKKEKDIITTEIPSPKSFEYDGQDIDETTSSDVEKELHHEKLPFNEVYQRPESPDYDEESYEVKYPEHEILDTKIEFENYVKETPIFDPSFSEEHIALKEDNATLETDDHKVYQTLMKKDELIAELPKDEDNQGDYEKVSSLPTLYTDENKEEVKILDKDEPLPLYETSLYDMHPTTEESYTEQQKNKEMYISENISNIKDDSTDSDKVKEFISEDINDKKETTNDSSLTKEDHDVEFTLDKTLSQKFPIEEQEIVECHAINEESVIEQRQLDDIRIPRSLSAQYETFEEKPETVDDENEIFTKSPEIKDEYDNVETIVSTTTTYYDDLDKPYEDIVQQDYQTDLQPKVSDSKFMPKTFEEKEEILSESPEIKTDFESYEVTVEPTTIDEKKDGDSDKAEIIESPIIEDIVDSQLPSVERKYSVESPVEKREIISESPEDLDESNIVESVVTTTTTTYYDDSVNHVGETEHPDYEKYYQPDVKDSEPVVDEELSETIKKSPEFTDDYKNVETTTTATTYYDDLDKPVEELPEAINEKEEIITKSPESKDDYETIETITTTTTYYDNSNEHVKEKVESDYEKDLQPEIEGSESFVGEKVPEAVTVGDEEITKSPEIKDDYETVKTIATTTTNYDDLEKPIEKSDQYDFEKDYQSEPQNQELNIVEEVPKVVEQIEETVRKSPEIKDDYETVETIVTTTTYYDDSDKPNDEMHQADYEKEHQPDFQDQEQKIIEKLPETIENKEETIIKSPELTNDYKTVETIVTTTTTYYDESDKPIEETDQQDYQIDLQPEIKDNESVVEEKVPKTVDYKEETVTKSPELTDDYEKVETIVTTTTTYYDDSDKQIKETDQHNLDIEPKPKVEAQESQVIEQLPETIEHQEDMLTKSPEVKDNYETVETIVTTTTYYDDSDKPIEERYQPDFKIDSQQEIKESEFVVESIPEKLDEKEDIISESPEKLEKSDIVKNVVTTTTYYDDSDKPIEKEDQYDYESYIQPEIKDHESVVKPISEKYDEKEEIITESPEIKTDFESYEVTVEPTITDENKDGDSEKPEFIESPIIEDIVDSQLPSIERKYSVESPVEKRKIISESSEDSDDKNIVESVVTTTTTYYDDSIKHVKEIEHPDYEKYYQPDVEDSEPVVDEELSETIQHTDEIVSMSPKLKDEFEIVETTIPSISYSDDKEIDSQIEISNIVTKEQEDDDLHKPCEDLTPEVSHYDMDKKIEEYHEPEVKKEDILSSDKFVDSIVTKDDTAEPFIKEEVVKDDLHDVKSTIRSQLIFDEIQHRPESPTSEDEYLPESHKKKKDIITTEIPSPKSFEYGGQDIDETTSSDVEKELHHEKLPFNEVYQRPESPDYDEESYEVKYPEQVQLEINPIISSDTEGKISTEEEKATVDTASPIDEVELITKDQKKADFKYLEDISMYVPEQIPETPTSESEQFVEAQIHNLDHFTESPMKDNECHVVETVTMSSVYHDDSDLHLPEVSSETQKSNVDLKISFDETDHHIKDSKQDKFEQISDQKTSVVIKDFDDKLMETEKPLSSKSSISEDLNVEKEKSSSDKKVIIPAPTDFDNLGRRSSDLFKDSYIKSDVSFDEHSSKEEEKRLDENIGMKNIHDTDYVVVSPRDDQNDLKVESYTHLDTSPVLDKKSDESPHSSNVEDEFFAGYSIKSESPVKTVSSDEEKDSEMLRQQGSLNVEPCEDEFFAGKSISTNETISVFKSDVFDHEQDILTKESTNNDVLSKDDIETAKQTSEDYLDKDTEEKSDDSTDEKADDKKDLFEDEFFAGISIKQEKIPHDEIYPSDNDTLEKHTSDKVSKFSSQEDLTEESKSSETYHDSENASQEDSQPLTKEHDESSSFEKEFFSGVSIKKSPSKEDVKETETFDKDIEKLDKLSSELQEETIESDDHKIETSDIKLISPVSKLSEENKQEDIVETSSEIDKRDEKDFEKILVDKDDKTSEKELTSKDDKSLVIEEIYPISGVSSKTLLDFVEHSQSLISSPEKIVLDDNVEMDKDEVEQFKDKNYDSLESFAEKESIDIVSSILPKTKEVDDLQDKLLEVKDGTIPSTDEKINKHQEADSETYDEFFKAIAHKEEPLLSSDEKGTLSDIEIETKALEEFAENESKQIVDECFAISKPSDFSKQLVDEVVHELSEKAESLTSDSEMDIPTKQRHKFSDTVISKIEDTHIIEKPFIAEETSRIVEDITNELITELEEIEEAEEKIEENLESDEKIMEKSLIKQEDENIVDNIMESIKLESKILNIFNDDKKLSDSSLITSPTTIQEKHSEDAIVDPEYVHQDTNQDLTLEDDTKIDQTFIFVEDTDIPQYEYLKSPHSPRLEHLEQSIDILKESPLDEMALIERKLSTSIVDESIVESEDVDVKFNESNKYSKEGKVHASYLTSEPVFVIPEKEEDIETHQKDDVDESLFIVDSEELSNDSEIKINQEDNTTYIVDEAKQQLTSNVIDDPNKELFKEETTTDLSQNIDVYDEDKKIDTYDSDKEVDSSQFLDKISEKDLLFDDVKYDDIYGKKSHQEIPEDPMTSSIFVGHDDKNIFDTEDDKIASSATSSPNPFMTEDEIQEHKKFFLTDSESVDDYIHESDNISTGYEDFSNQRDTQEQLIFDEKSTSDEKLTKSLIHFDDNIEKEEKLLFDDDDDNISEQPQLIELSDSDEEDVNIDNKKIELSGLEQQETKLLKSHSETLSADIESPQTVIDKFETLEKDFTLEENKDEIKTEISPNNDVMTQSIDSLNGQEVTPSTDNSGNIIDNFIFDDKSLERRVSSSSDKNNHYSKSKTHQSSDNISESSLQEFERLEAELFKKSGDVSPSSDESEGAKSRVSDDRTGSRNSLNEFERLEKELAEPTNENNEVMMLSYIREESEYEDMSIKEDEENVDSLNDPSSDNQKEIENKDAMSESIVVTDSLEQIPQIPSILETSVDSLEVSNIYGIDDKRKIQEDESKYHDEFEREPKSKSGNIIEACVIPGNEGLDNDSLLGFSSSNQTEDSNTYTSQNTEDTFQEYHDDDKDSLEGDLSIIGSDIPTTITTFKSTKISPTGSTEIISRRVLTKVTDPIICRVKFTGTESEERLQSLDPNISIETTDAEGNVTTTVKHQQSQQ